MTLLAAAKATTARTGVIFRVVVVGVVQLLRVAAPLLLLLLYLVVTIAVLYNNDDVGPTKTTTTTTKTERNKNSYYYYYSRGSEHRSRSRSDDDDDDDNNGETEQSPLPLRRRRTILPEPLEYLRLLSMTTATRSAAAAANRSEDGRDGDDVDDDDEAELEERVRRYASQVAEALAPLDGDDDDDGGLDSSCSCRNGSAAPFDERCCRRLFRRSHKMGRVATRTFLKAWRPFFVRTFADPTDYGYYEFDSNGGNDGDDQRASSPALPRSALFSLAPDPQETQTQRPRSSSFLSTSPPPLQDFRDAYLFRDLFESLVSGYLYHRSGRECWLDPEGRTGNPRPDRYNKFTVREFLRERYYVVSVQGNSSSSFDVGGGTRSGTATAENDNKNTTVSDKDSRPTSTATSLCEYLADNATTDVEGMRTYIDWVFHSEVRVCTVCTALRLLLLLSSQKLPGSIIIIANEFPLPLYFVLIPLTPTAVTSYTHLKVPCPFFELGIGAARTGDRRTHHVGVLRGLDRRHGRKSQRRNEPRFGFSFQRQRRRRFFRVVVDDDDESPPRIHARSAQTEKRRRRRTRKCGGCRDLLKKTDACDVRCCVIPGRKFYKVAIHVHSLTRVCFLLFFNDYVSFY